MQNAEHLFPLVVTTDISQTKKFYCETLGWEATFEAKHYLQVRAPGGPNAPEICFMDDQQGFPVFGGRGLVLSVPTPNADGLATELLDRGARLDNRPEDRPWGWRSFHITDPSGVILDFFHVVEENPVLQDATS